MRDLVMTHILLNTSASKVTRECETGVKGARER